LNDQASYARAEQEALHGHHSYQLLLFKAHKIKIPMVGTR